MLSENFDKLLRDHEKQLKKERIKIFIKYGLALVLWAVGDFLCLYWFDFKLLIVLFILFWANNID